MSVLTVNLRHLYQRRLLWLVHAVAVVTVGTAAALGGRCQILSGLFIAVLAGLVYGSFQRQTLYPPFVFLLPGHSRNVPRQALVLGTLLGLLASLASLISTGTSASVALALWPLSVAGYTVGTLVGLLLPFAGALLSVIPALLYGMALLGFVPAVELLVQQHLVVVSCLALGTIPWTWRALASRDHARRCCGLRATPAMDWAGMDKEQALQQWSRDQAKGRTPDLGNPSVSRYLLSAIRQTLPGIRRDCCAVWYEWFGALTPGQTARRLVFPFMAMLAVGYCATGDRAGPLFLLPAVMAIPRSYVHTRTWLPLGRRERLTVALAELLVALLHGFVLAGVLAAASQVVAPFLPSWTIRGNNLVFSPLPWRYLLLTAIATPVTMAARTWLGKAHTDTLMVAVMILFGGMVVAIPFSDPLPIAAWPLVLGGSLLVSWLALRYHCLRRDLA